MTAPSYTTDLATIVLCETGDTFEEFTGYILGDNAALETDWYLQGSSCASDEANGKTGVGHSIGFDYGSNITFATGDCIFAWMMCMAPNGMDTFANGGYRILAGSGIGDFDGWKVGGSNFGRNPYGGWTNVAVDPTFTPDYTTGTPTALRHFAVAFNLVSAISKGRPNNMDAVRYGRGDFIVEYGELTLGYATVTGMATANDGSSARWGLMQGVGETFLWKGLWTLGTSTNAVDFRDSNRNINVDDTPRTFAAFNRIEVNNASSRVDWTAINITAPNSSISGSVLARGEFEAIDDADINKDTCVFTDMSTFKYQSNSTIVSTTWRRCGIVTQDDATVTSCIFDGSANTHALLATNPSVITDTNFISGGSGHAMRCDQTGTYTWSNTDSGYTGTRGSNLVSSTGSADAMFYNNSGGLITLNISGSGQQPSVRNGAGATTQVNADVNVTFSNMRDNTEVRIYKTSDDSVVDGIENATAGTTDARTFTWTAGAGTDVYYVLHNWNGTEPFYQTIRVEGYIVPSSDTTIVIQQQIDRNAA